MCYTAAATGVYLPMSLPPNSSSRYSERKESAEKLHQRLSLAAAI
jgi:hypothetical protein